MARFLFTLQISDDLGLLTRSLPIARELAGRGHEVAFCNPARAPSQTRQFVVPRGKPIIGRTGGNCKGSGP